MGSSDQKNVFLAVILSGLVLFTWQSYFAPKPMAPVAGVVQNDSNSTGLPISQSINGETTTVAVDKAVSAEAITIITKPVTISNNGNSITFNSDLTVLSFENANRKLSFIDVTGKENSLSVQIMTNTGFKNINFEFSKVSEFKTVGTNNETQAQITLTIDEKGVVSGSLVSPMELSYRFRFQSEKKELENRKIRIYSVYNNSELDTYNVGSEDNAEGSFDWVAVDFNYRLFALVFPNKALGRLATTEQGIMNFDLVKSTKELNFSLVFTEKSYDALVTYKNKLEHSVDFGFFAILAVPILRGLQFFYNVVPNWGIAIILITLVIRLITFPLQFKSFKSMKKMQTIQPELAKLKEKFKDDPPRMQKETMALFKKAGANPLGGCLPMVLQMPVFFAFYQVLYNAYELVDAPFIFWIKDLSIKDPMYVLPVIMGIAMFFQTKLNPSAGADPAQKKLMMFMPLIFTFIMKDLPAGLNLYIFVSTLFGIGQQLFVYKVID